MIKEDCVFCNLANGIWDAATLYEDEEFRVVLDLGPAAKGHALILPKEHYADLFELPEEKAKNAMALAKKMGPVMIKALAADGLNVVQNNGEAAGQTVFHYHLHLIPRYKGDDSGFGWRPGKLEEETKKEILEKVAACMK